MISNIFEFEKTKRGFKIISEFNKLTSEKRVKVFILDDTVLNKSRSKKMVLQLYL